MTTTARLRKVLLALGVLALAGVLAVVGTGLFLQHRLASHLHRIPGVFDGLTHRPTRPSGEAGKALNILLLGTDRRSDVPTTGADAEAPSWIPGEQGTDTVMVMHIDADRRAATLISIPRDSWVAVPGHGMAKINAAFSYAGPALAVKTVEQLTGVRIDHLAVVDWTGFEALTDRLGGITVDIPATVHDSARGITWTAGEHELDGKQALAYVGQRYGLPGGDFDRIHRQEYFLRKLMDGTLHQELRHQPTTVYAILDILSRHLSVDAGWSSGDMRNLAWSLRNMRSAAIDYVTAPIAGTGRVGSQSVVHLDPSANRALWRAVRSDRVTQWAAAHPSAGVPAVVR